MLKSIDGGVFFVAGVHGVGKGALLEQLKFLTSLESFSSSALIKSAKGKAVDVKKIVIDPDDNQELLLYAIREKLKNDRFIFLDGHFVLRNESGFYYIPDEVFDSLPICAYFLLTEDPTIISDRIQRRDGFSLPLEVIDELQKREVEKALYLSNTKHVPLIRLKSTDSHKVLDWLDENHLKDCAK